MTSGALAMSSESASRVCRRGLAARLSPWRRPALSGLDRASIWEHKPCAGQSRKLLSGEELGAELRVDAGSEALSVQGASRLIGFEEIVAAVSDDGEV